MISLHKQNSITYPVHRRHFHARSRPFEGFKMAILEPSNGLRLPQMKPDCVHQKRRSACVCYTILRSKRIIMLYAHPAKTQYKSMASAQYSPMASTHPRNTTIQATQRRNPVLQTHEIYPPQPLQGPYISCSIFII